MRCSRWRTVPIPPSPLWCSSRLRYRPNLVPCVHKRSPGIRLFAEDTIMYLAIHSEDQCAQLQSDLGNLQSWEKDWLMEFNSDKCEVLRVTRKKSMIHHDYTLHGKVLRSVTSARYLGVQLSHDLKWNSHISNVTAKADRTLGFLKRNLRVKNVNSSKRHMLALYAPS